jgi:hypothetical protein
MDVQTLALSSKARAQILSTHVRMAPTAYIIWTNILMQSKCHRLLKVCSPRADWPKLKRRCIQKLKRRCIQIFIDENTDAYCTTNPSNPTVLIGTGRLSGRGAQRSTHQTIHFAATSEKTTSYNGNSNDLVSTKSAVITSIIKLKLESFKSMLVHCQNFQGCL